jgi:predicted nucleotide-binding protein
MWACNYGIGLLENRLGKAEGLNDNVLIELGSMSIIGRQCAILKDPASPNAPTDLAGHIYKTVDFDDLEAVDAAAHRWIVEDLGLSRCEACP